MAEGFFNPTALTAEYMCVQDGASRADQGFSVAAAVASTERAGIALELVIERRNTHSDVDLTSTRPCQTKTCTLERPKVL